MYVLSFWILEGESELEYGVKLCWNGRVVGGVGLVSIERVVILEVCFFLCS